MKRKGHITKLETFLSKGNEGHIVEVTIRIAEIRDYKDTDPEYAYQPVCRGMYGLADEVIMELPDRSDKMPRGESEGL